MAGQHCGKGRARLWLGAGMLACLLTGCTTLKEYWHNGLKVGPNYSRPPAAVADRWIDQDDPRLRLDPEEHRRWWKAFHDPVLDDLICAAFQQNLELKRESFRVLEYQAILGTVIGRFFPQTQTASGSYTRTGLSSKVANREFIPQRFYDAWVYGVGLAWELDIWGKYRRDIESFQALLDSSVEGYDDKLVSVLAEVATQYTTYRTLDAQIEYVKANVRLQQETLKVAQARFKGGLVSELDVDQAESLLQQTLADVPQLEIQQRQAQNRLCVLLGVPPFEMRVKLGTKPIPTAPPDVILGVPAELIQRRPDVRKAEREAAARCARIGIAESEWYPAVTITGDIGYQAQNFPDLFNSKAMQGRIGPSFNWKVLNYGRIANDVLRTEANFQQAVLEYQQAVLKANEEAENGVVKFLKAQQRLRDQSLAVKAAEKAVVVALAQYKAGQIDFNRVSVIEQNLVQQQLTEAAAQGEIAEGLIAVYKALGGGWQVRLDGCVCVGAPAPAEPVIPSAPLGAPDRLPTPTPPPKGDPQLDNKPPADEPGQGQGGGLTAVVPTKLPPRRSPR
ncbi:MAG: efflux transporter outer membrane subunit [Gemmataceae bacterium]